LRNEDSDLFKLIGWFIEEQNREHF